MIVLGIDPGLTGGLALVQSGERPRVLFAGDIPTIGEDAKKRIHAAAVIALIVKYQPSHGFIERAQAMPDQGASSGFIYGRAVGALETCVQGMGIPLTIIETTAWKKAHGLIRPGHIDPKAWQKVVKEQSRQRAILLFPEADFFQRKLDHGRAEACLIGHYGLQSLNALPKPPQSPLRVARPSAQLSLLAAKPDSV